MAHDRFHTFIARGSLAQEPDVFRIRSQGLLLERCLHRAGAIAHRQLVVGRRLEVVGAVFKRQVRCRFHAFDQKSGQVLWEINLGSPVTGFPISFAVDGRRATGSRLWWLR